MHGRGNEEKGVEEDEELPSHPAVELAEWVGEEKGKAQNNVVVQMIISQYMKRMKAIAAAKAATATPWQPSPEDAAADATVPEDTGYSKITFQRIDRGVPA